MDELIGKDFGSYTLVERIGEGGMAVVYKGYQASLHRHVAIKVLRGNLARDRQFVARFQREALAVAKLSHPNILHVYDAGVAHGVYYIAMDYAEGGTLKDLLRGGPLPFGRAVSIATQLAEALDYAHRQGLVHRDVKPSNVLLTSEGRPLLSDFGIAKALHQSSQLTRTGARIGTPEYMAPEQAEGAPPDGRADIYALGIVLYEMLVGRVPFRADTPMATLYQHLYETPLPLRKVNRQIPAWLEAVVEKTLAKQPGERYRSGDELAMALRQQQAPIIKKKTRPATPVPPPSKPSPRRRPSERQRQRNPAIFLLGAITLLTLVMLVALVVLLQGGDGGSNTAGRQIVTQVVTERLRTVVVTPVPNETPTAPPVATAIPPASPTPPQASSATWYIPTLEADITNLQFFESGYQQTPHDERVYSNRFAQAETRYIYYEISIKYPEHTQDLDFAVEIIYYGPDGAVFSEFSANHSIEADWTSSWHAKGWGWDDPGQWDLGTYRAELYVDGDLIAADSFEIYE